MAPGIQRSLREGFLTANKSWAGIGVFAGGWLVVILLAIAGVALTNPPAELLQERPVGEEAVVPPVPIPAPAEAQATQEAAQTPEAKPADVFQQLSSTADVPPTAQAPAAEAPAVPAVPSPEAAAREEAARRDRLAGEYFGRAWPLLLGCLLLIIGGNLFLSGGQIGYLAQRMTTGQARVSEVWRAGSRAFVSLLLGMLLSIAAVAGVILIGVLLIMAFAALANVTPPGVDMVLGLLGFVVGLAALVALVWLMVRLAFWFIAIVGERVGPIAGLKRSFRASRGQWWRLVGLGLLMALISYGIWLPLGLVEWAGNRIGGPVAVGLGVTSNVVGLITSLYVGFAALAAYIRFYEDAKSASAGASHPAAP